MLTLALLFLEAWKVFRRPRKTPVRKSSFRRKIPEEQLHQSLDPNPSPQQQQQQQQQHNKHQQEELYTQQQYSQQRQQQQQQQYHNQDQQVQPTTFRQTSAYQQENLPPHSSNGDHRKGTNITTPTTVPTTSNTTTSSSNSGSSGSNCNNTSNDAALSREPETVVSRAIPVASKRLVPFQAPSGSQPTQTTATAKEITETTATIPDSRVIAPSTSPTAHAPVSTQPTSPQLESSTPGNQPKMAGNDDKWAKEQIRQFQFKFDETDKDRNGSLSVDEVYSIMTRNGFNGSKADVEKIFNHMDKDCNQKVSKKEFDQTIDSLPRMNLKEFALRKAFVTLDKDKSGKLSREEIINATKSAGVNISADKISEMLIFIANDDDGKVRYDEFLKIFGLESTATVFWKIFSTLDKDKSGWLSRDEIMDGVMKDFELKLSADKISQLLISHCKDKDGKIDYNEFVDSWLQQRGKKN